MSQEKQRLGQRGCQNKDDQEHWGTVVCGKYGLHHPGPLPRICLPPAWPTGSPVGNQPPAVSSFKGWPLCKEPPCWACPPICLPGPVTHFRFSLTPPHLLWALSVFRTSSHRNVPPPLMRRAALLQAMFVPGHIL